MIEDIFTEEDGTPLFVVQYPEQDFENYIRFKVFEVTSCTSNDYGKTYTEIAEKEEYLNGSIKWDGCSTISFQEGLHLCGLYHWKKHNRLMSFLWRVVTERIKDFDIELAK